jgi:GPI mannosyltransferase 3
MVESSAGRRTPPSGAPGETAPWLVPGLVLLALVPRAYLAVTDHGLFWADEIFQSLEQGHRLAFGYGLIPWEFQEGVRSWLFPGVLGGVMKLASLCGARDGMALAVVAKLLMAACSALAFYPALRLARSLGGAAAVVLVALVGLCFPAALLFGSRALGEVLSAVLIAWAAWLTLDPARGARRARDGGLAGLLAGLAVFVRYQTGLVWLALGLLLLGQRRWRAAGRFALAAGLVAMAGGALDWLTWGRPFQSLLLYLRFNLVEGQAAGWGTAPASFFLQTAWQSTGWALVPLVIGLVCGLRRTWRLVFVLAVFVLAHSLVPHKESRFLVPVLPLFFVAAGVGLTVLLEHLARPPARVRVAAGLGTLLALAMAWRASQLTFADLGQSMDAELDATAGPPSAWHAFEGVNRLLARAGRQPDLCGLAATGVNAYWTGGYTYLHRRVPLLWQAGAKELAAANYLIVGPPGGPRPPGYGPIDQDRGYLLLKRAGACRPPVGALKRYDTLRPGGITP